jgi:hypothetical protein
VSIKAGQKFRWIAPSGDYFTNGTVYEVLRDASGDFAEFIIEDDHYQRGDKDMPHHWNDDADFHSKFEPADGPVVTVLTKRIVPGTYGDVEVDNVNSEGVSIWLPRNSRYTASALTAMAKTLTEIAGALGDA